MKPFKQATLTAMIALMAMPVLAQTEGFDSTRYYGHMMGGYGHGYFGGARMLVFWVVVIAAIVFAVRWLGKQPQHRLAVGGRRHSLPV